MYRIVSYSNQKCHGRTDCEQTDGCGRNIPLITCSSSGSSSGGHGGSSSSRGVCEFSTCSSILTLYLSSQMHTTHNEFLVTDSMCLAVVVVVIVVVVVAAAAAAAVVVVVVLVVVVVVLVVV